MFDTCPCFSAVHDSIDDSMHCYNCIYYLSKCDFDDNYLDFIPLKSLEIDDNTCYNNSNEQIDIVSLNQSYSSIMSYQLLC